MRPGIYRFGSILRGRGGLVQVELRHYSWHVCFGVSRLCLYAIKSLAISGVMSRQRRKTILTDSIANRMNAMTNESYGPSPTNHISVNTPATSVPPVQAPP
jgi:hypothetical protein